MFSKQSNVAHSQFVTYAIGKDDIIISILD